MGNTSTKNKDITWLGGKSNYNPLLHRCVECGMVYDGKIDTCLFTVVGRKMYTIHQHGINVSILVRDNILCNFVLPEITPLSIMGAYEPILTGYATDLVTMKVFYALHLDKIMRLQRSGIVPREIADFISYLLFIDFV